VARKKQAASKVDTNAWMTTFSDLLNLLLTFFVLLLTMSSLDNKRLKETFGYFNEAVAGLGTRSATEITPPVRNFPPPILPTALFKDLRKYLSGGKKKRTPKNLDRLRRKLTMLGMADLVGFQEAIDGLRISVDSEPLFAPGSADPLPSAIPFLTGVAQLSRDLDRQMIIECFWDGKDYSNGNQTGVSKDLAVARSAALGELFVRRFGMKGKNIGISASSVPIKSERGRVRFTYMD